LGGIAIIGFVVLVAATAVVLVHVGNTINDNYSLQINDFVNDAGGRVVDFAHDVGRGIGDLFSTGREWFDE